MALNLDNNRLSEIAWHNSLSLIALVGIRDIEQKGNKRGVFDDAIFLVTPKQNYRFQANCDPSVFKPGTASLDPGTYKYKLGIHGLSKPKWRQYEALVQAEPVNITRDGGKKERGFFGINIHKGGLLGSTSSLGCQTIKRDEWDRFLLYVKEYMKDNRKTEIPYVLKNGSDL